MRGFYGWKLVAVFWLILAINLAFPAYGSSVINAYMAEAMAMERSMLGMLFSVYMIMSGLPGPLVAYCVNRIGVRLTLVLGSLILLTGSLLMAMFVTTPFQALLVFGLVIGTGVVTGSALASQTGVTFWFVRRRALALSIVLSAASVGGFVAAPVLDYVIAAFDNWRAGWWLIAALTCVSTLMAALFVRNKPEDMAQSADGGVALSASTEGTETKRRVFITRQEWRLAETLRSPVLWLLMLCAVGVSAGFTLYMAHGVVHLKDLGHTPTMAAMSISFMVFGNLFGKLILGAFGDRVEPRFLWAGAMAIFSLGMLMVVDATEVMDIYVFASCLGLGFGGSVVCMVTVLGNYYGTKVYASVIGVAMAIQTTASAIAPLVAGEVYDTTGSYAVPFYSIAALCLAGALLLLFVRPPVKAKAATEEADRIDQGIEEI